MKKIIYCKKCHEKKRYGSYEKAQEEIEKKFEGVKVEDGCVSGCGLGRRSFLAQIDEELITSETFEEMVEDLEGEL